MVQLFSPDDDVIGKIHNQLAHLEKITRIPPPTQPLTKEQLSVLIETAFWSSLGSNEGRPTRVCISVASPETLPGALKFASPVLYEKSQIVKLSPAVPPGGCLLTSAVNDDFRIWGFACDRLGYSMGSVTVEISEPGTVRVDVGPLQPYAVLTGDSTSFVGGTRVDFPGFLHAILRKALPKNDIIETQAVWRECIALANLGRMIVENGHGGIVLIVPTEGDDCLKFMEPFPYRFTPPDTRIPDAIRKSLSEQAAMGDVFQQLSESSLPDDQKNLAMRSLTRPTWDVTRQVREIASLSGVDGAIVMTKELQTLGFGATLTVEKDFASQICILRPELGPQEANLSPLEDLGGTRHQSAARFVAKNKDSIALVISQDRHMSVMHWHEPSNSVAVVENTEWLL